MELKAEAKIDFASSCKTFWLQLSIAVVCTISKFSQIVIADVVPIHVKEFVGFCENNGHKYLTIFDDGNSAEYQENFLMMKLGMY